MNSRRLIDIAKNLNIPFVSIPLAVTLASLFFPLKPVVQQALVGVMLMWVVLGSMTGFPFWK